MEYEQIFLHLAKNLQDIADRIAGWSQSVATFYYDIIFNYGE